LLHEINLLFINSSLKFLSVSKLGLEKFSVSELLLTLNLIIFNPSLNDNSNKIIYKEPPFTSKTSKSSVKTLIYDNNSPFPPVSKNLFNKNITNNSPMFHRLNLHKNYNNNNYSNNNNNNKDDNIDKNNNNNKDDNIDNNNNNNKDDNIDNNNNKDDNIDNNNNNNNKDDSIDKNNNNNNNNNNNLPNFKINSSINFNNKRPLNSLISDLKKQK